MNARYLLVAMLAVGMLLGFSGAATATVTPAPDDGADGANIPPCEPVGENTCCIDTDYDGEYEQCYDTS